MIGDAVASSTSCRLADLLAFLRSCKKLHGALMDVLYLEATRRDGMQLLREPFPELTPTSVPAPMPVALWASERNRVDTLALLWKAQARLRATRACSSAFAASRGPPDAAFAPLTSAFWYPLPHDCRHDPTHTPWGPRRRPDSDDDDDDDDNEDEEQVNDLMPIVTGWCTALHLAAREGHNETVRALVTTYGAYVDATARYVCVCRSLHMRHIRFTKGIAALDLEPVTTPLHVALANGHDSTARLLVELGAVWSEEIAFQPDFQYPPSNSRSGGGR